jgi:hypothetical protein
MYSAAFIGVACGCLVLLVEYLTIERIFSHNGAKGDKKLHRTILSREREDLLKGEIELEGTVEKVKEKIDHSLRFLYLSSKVKEVHKTQNSISLRIHGLNLPEEITYTVSKGWTKPVKVTYTLDLTRQKMKFRRLSYFLLYGIAVPISIAIPWLVVLVVTQYPEQRVQLIQLLHLWHIWWPFFPFIIYRKTKRMSRDFFENILRL